MWIEKLARLGYATKGIVYAIVGILAVKIAVYSGAEKADSAGALHAIAAQPFGQILLILIAVGLAAYALWRFVEAVLDPERQGGDADGVVHRLGYAISGLIYGGLAAEATLLIVDASKASGNSGDSTSDWTARLLQQPFGQWLVGIVGAGIIGFGFYWLYRAYSTKFRKKLDLGRMSQQQKTWAIRISRIGIAARGIVFVLIGSFLIQAARQYDPSKAKGTDGALHALAQQPFGKVLLAIVALGLIAYGIYMGIQARYRRIRSPRLPI